MGKLDGRIALVTGGGTGIGKSISVLFSKEGANVVIIGRDEESLKETCNLNVKKISCDFPKHLKDKIEKEYNNYIQELINKAKDMNHSWRYNQRRKYKKTIEYINKKFGKLDILVNNAGISITEPLKELKISNYDKTFDINVRALVNMTINCLPLILKSKGNILNISSINSTYSHPKMSIYQGSKAAVDSFTRCWAKELAKDGVRVNAIAPGSIETDIWNKANMPPEQIIKYKGIVKNSIPCGRFGTPEEVSNLALFIVSDDASYVNGSIIAIDGAGDF